MWRVEHVTLTGCSLGTDYCWVGSVSQKVLKVRAGVVVRILPGNCRPLEGVGMT